MIIFLEATQMIIKRLEIKGLHGVYDYNVSFNDDVTFLYGENGCGKTTVLDIVSSIVTGKIYNLFRYRFDEISLSYREKKRKKLNRITIKSLEDAYELSLNEEEYREVIKDPYKTGEMYSRDEDEYVFDRRFVSRYAFPNFLRKTFNYIYLPLSRNSQDGIDMMNSIAYRRRRTIMISDTDYMGKNYLNESLRYVEEIVKDGCMRISSAETKVDAQFKSNIFTSSLTITNNYNFSRLFSQARGKETLESIEQNRLDYIKTLRAIGEWNDDTSKRLEDFIKKYQIAFEAAKEDERTGKHGISVDFLLMNIEFNRIRDIAEHAKKIEKEKEIIRGPITSFLTTVNDFFSIGQEKKKISIENGEIIIEAESPHRKLSLYNLSSGEKQIIIILACLIFGLPAGQSGIYIIDEPEASLHLAWQKKFVESIQRVNGSIQLVFATHSPEIIGKYDDHAVKLKRKVRIENKEKDDKYDE